MLQSAPKQIEFGHVCENPNEWEQRYEKKDFDRNRHQGKVRRTRPITETKLVTNTKLAVNPS